MDPSKPDIYVVMYIYISLEPHSHGTSTGLDMHEAKRQIYRYNFTDIKFGLGGRI